VNRCDWQVIEAVYEDLKLKREIFSKLDDLCKPAAILCTNTSTLDIDLVSHFIILNELVEFFFTKVHVLCLLICAVVEFVSLISSMTCC